MIFEEKKKAEKKERKKGEKKEKKLKGKFACVATQLGCPNCPHSFLLAQPSSRPPPQQMEAGGFTPSLIPSDSTCSLVRRRSGMLAGMPAIKA